MIEFALAFYMQKTSYSEISEFKTWLSKNNLPKMVQNVENKYLGLFKTVKLQASTNQQIKDMIIANIVC